MRRRSERKKSTDVSSPAPARRTGRRRKSASLSEDAEGTNELKNDQKAEEDNLSSKENDQDSSDERVGDGKRRRGSRRTPVREQRSSPSKRRTKHESTSENKIDSIPEEENGKDDKTGDSEAGPNEETTTEVVENKESTQDELKNSKEEEKLTADDSSLVQNEEKNNDSEAEKIKRIDEEVRDDAGEEKSKEKTKEDSNAKSESEEDRNKDEVKLQTLEHTSRMSAKSESGEEPDKDEVKLHTRDNSSRSRSNSSESPKERKSIQNAEPAKDEKDEEPEDGEVIEKEENNSQTNDLKQKTDCDDCPKGKDTQELEVKQTQDDKPNEPSNTTAAADTGRPSISATTTTTTTTRKRRWITKKGTESKEAVLAISTDSLKTLIADVQPVPLSDVQLESSSDVEEVVSEREEGEQSPSPEPEIRRRKDSNPDALSSSKLNSIKENNTMKHGVSGVLGAVPAPIHRSPSPARNQSSSVLYITNLVRPFTVLQLKGLLARTGKIVEDGFWIDRIKSKCYVEYQNEDEAIETRHALHGVRWPASNPKCLNVDFGRKSDMLKAVDSTKEDVPKFGIETSKDNILMGMGWNRERQEEEKKSSRPVREWDVGKKENLEREKDLKDSERRRERSRERSRDDRRDRTRESRGRENSRHRENERERERRRERRDRDVRSSSISPARKLKKKDDPPLRLLDDLFRKTKSTPCIYWLPLTPEQIAEKESLRLKRLEEQKQRLKQREIEREKERKDRERMRNNDRGRDRDRDRNDRRRSRSRDRRDRRY